MRLNKRSFPSDRNVSLAGGNRLSIFIEIKYKWLIETVNYDNYAKLTRVKGYNKKVFKKKLRENLRGEEIFNPQPLN